MLEVCTIGPGCFESLSNPALQKRVQNCQVVFYYSVYNTGGGPGQGQFTNINSGVGISREGTGVWSNQDNTFAASYSKDVSASDWGGDDPVRIESAFLSPFLSLRSEHA